MELQNRNVAATNANQKCRMSGFPSWLIEYGKVDLEHSAGNAVGDCVNRPMIRGDYAVDNRQPQTQIVFAYLG